MSSSLTFYQDLPLIHRFADVVDERHYLSVPEDWDVVLSDVRGSTAAIEAGRYQDVNSLGAATIIAVRNALPNLDLPFVFGGDGATLLTPSQERATVASTLRGLMHLAQSTFDLELRCGLVPMQALRQAGYGLKLGKFRASPNVTLAMFMGSALAIAESWVKHPTSDHDAAITTGPSVAPDLTGFECRWQPVKSQQGVTVALLVSALGEHQERQRTYAELLTHIDALTGSEAPVPIHPSNLHLKSPLGDFSIEARLRSNQRSGKHFERAVREARTRVALGQALFATGGSLASFNARSYKQELLQNCDFRKFDDVLRMILDVSHATHTALHQMLERYRHGVSSATAPTPRTPRWSLATFARTAATICISSTAQREVTRSPPRSSRHSSRQALGDSVQRPLDLTGTVPRGSGDSSPRLTRKVAPRGSVSKTVIDQPCSSTIRLTTAKPMPVPCERVV